MVPRRIKIRAEGEPTLTRRVERGPGEEITCEGHRKAGSSEDLRNDENSHAQETTSEPFSLADYAKLTQRNDLSVDTIYRSVVCNLPRCPPLCQ